MAAEDLDLPNKVIGSEGFDWSQLQDEEDLLNLKAVAKAKKHAKKQHVRLTNLGYRGCDGDLLDLGEDANVHGSVTINTKYHHCLKGNMKLNPGSWLKIIATNGDEFRIWA